VTRSHQLSLAVRDAPVDLDAALALLGEHWSEVAFMLPRGDRGLDAISRIVALFSNEDLYSAVEDCFPRGDPSRGGRPRIYPAYLFFAIDAMAKVFPSIRATMALLANPYMWTLIRALVVQHAPSRDLHLPTTAPDRTWYIHTRNRAIKANPEYQAMLTETGVKDALEAGLCDPGGPGSRNHPDLSRTAYTDGKAIRQLFNTAAGDTRTIKTVDPLTGEQVLRDVPVRCDPDATVFRTGDKRQIHGSKFFHAEVRGDEPFSRIFLAVDKVPATKGGNDSEDAVTVKNVLDIASRLPGLQALATDGVLRGTHVDEVQSNTGIVVISPVAAKAVDKKNGNRTEKQYRVETVTFELESGATRDISVETIGGRLHQVDYKVDGTPIYLPLTRTGIIHRENTGTRTDRLHRLYGEWTVKHPAGGDSQSLRLPLFPTEKYKHLDFEWAENVRALPLGDPDNERLRGRRSDAEAANREIEDGLYRERAQSIGSDRQLMNLLAHAFLSNSIAKHVRRQRARSTSSLAA
jgi:hypothetical protein